MKRVVVNNNSKIYQIIGTWAEPFPPSLDVLDIDGTPIRAVLTTIADRYVVYTLMRHDS